MARYTDEIPNDFTDAELTALARERAIELMTMVDTDERAKLLNVVGSQQPFTALWNMMDSASLDVFYGAAAIAAQGLARGLK